MFEEIPSRWGDRVGFVVIHLGLHNFVLKLRVRLILGEQDLCHTLDGEVSLLAFSSDKIGSRNVSEIDRERD